MYFLKVCFYFNLKFHHLNVQAKTLLSSNVKRRQTSMSMSNVKYQKIFRRKVYQLIKHHNDNCLLLKCFNDFWKYFLMNVLGFYIAIIWFLMFMHLIYPKLDLFPKLVLHLALLEMIIVFVSLVIMFFNVSIEVINNQSKL